MPKIERGARRERQFARAAIDGDGAIGNQLDVLLAIEFVGAEHQAIRAARALEIGFGQGRTLIRQMRLIVDQADALAIAMLSQRGPELETRVTGADDQDRSLRHCLTPGRCEAAKCRGRAACCLAAAPVRPSVRTTRRTWPAPGRSPHFRAAPRPARRSHGYRCQRSYARWRGA